MLLTSDNGYDLKGDESEMIFCPKNSLRFSISSLVFLLLLGLSDKKVTAAGSWYNNVHAIIVFFD